MAFQLKFKEESVTLAGTGFEGSVTFVTVVRITVKVLGMPKRFIVRTRK